MIELAILREAMRTDRSPVLDLRKRVELIIELILLSKCFNAFVLLSLQNI
jgi:hypothetical protein